MRFSSYRTLLFALSAVGTSAYASPVLAQGETTQAAIVPPRLLSAPPVELPEGSAPAEPVKVELELTIDTSGHVSKASVVSSGGEAFDAKALSAAQAFELEPARRGSEPIAVTLRYVYVFPAVPPAVAAPAPAPAAPEPAPAPKPSPTPAAPPPSARADEPLESFEATAEVEAPPRETTKRSIKEEELTKIPGTRG